MAISNGTADSDVSDCRVLSIQSHVVSGYVGNKIATFTLQVNGFETDAINSVQFSNHSHYQHLKGEVLTSTQLNELFAGLELNCLHERFTHLLTGYVNSQSFIEELCSIVAQLKRQHPHLIYLCDPVLGDNGRLYVTEALVIFYRERLLRMADIITPNQFEAETLAEMKIGDEADALECISRLHSRGPQVVVISSVDTPDPNSLIGYASRRKADPETGEQSFEQFRIRIPKLGGFFVGTGDLFASSFLSWMAKTDFNVPKSLERSISTLQSVLLRTRESALKMAGGMDNMANIELKLVQSLEEIRNPVVKIFAETIENPSLKTN